jgi:tripartite ATP-independent transporter DctP family solute receptor
VRPINSPADMKGLKIRTPPDAVTIDIMQALGAEAQQIKFSELYVALQQGVVDGQENPLMNIYSSKLYEVQKYISLTSHKYEMTPFVMSKRTYDKMSDADRVIIRAAAAEATKLNRKLSLESDQQLIGESMRLIWLPSRPRHSPSPQSGSKVQRVRLLSKLLMPQPLLPLKNNKQYVIRNALHGTSTD